MSRPDTLPQTPLTADQLARWAARIADGRDEFPADLTGPDRVALAATVRLRLRRQLVKLVARAVADRLRAAGAEAEGVADHVRPQV